MEPRIKDLETIKEVFDKFGVRFIIVYGVALGFHRDGDFLPGDDDIDIAVIDPIDLKTRKAIGWALYDLGFGPQNIAFNVFGRMEPSELGYNGDAETGIIVCERNFKFTIFFFKVEECEQHGYEYVCTPKLGAKKLIATPVKFYKELEEIKINKKKYLIPSPIEDYLTFTYFDNWRDKNDRRHGDTYDMMHHANDEMYDAEGKNEVLIWKS
jgi:hypothetical protein